MLPPIGGKIASGKFFCFHLFLGKNHSSSTALVVSLWLCDRAQAKEKRSRKGTLTTLTTHLIYIATPSNLLMSKSNHSGACTGNIYQSFDANFRHCSVTNTLDKEDFFIWNFYPDHAPLPTEDPDSPPPPVLPRQSSLLRKIISRWKSLHYGEVEKWGEKYPTLTNYFAVNFDPKFPKFCT